MSFTDLDCIPCSDGSQRSPGRQQAIVSGQGLDVIYTCCAAREDCKIVIVSGQGLDVIYTCCAAREDSKRSSADNGWVLLYVHRNRRLIRDGSPGRPPRLSHSFWTLKRTRPWLHLHVRRGAFQFITSYICGPQRTLHDNTTSKINNLRYFQVECPTAVNVGLHVCVWLFCMCHRKEWDSCNGWTLMNIHGQQGHSSAMVRRYHGPLIRVWRKQGKKAERQTWSRI